jgi:hypothetical protein
LQYGSVIVIEGLLHRGQRKEEFSGLPLSPYFINSTNEQPERQTTNKILITTNLVIRIILPYFSLGGQPIIMLIAAVTAKLKGANTIDHAGNNPAE